MSTGYSRAPGRSPTEENFPYNAAIAAQSSDNLQLPYRTERSGSASSSGSGSGSGSGSSARFRSHTYAQVRSSVLSQDVVPPGSHQNLEGELGPYSSLRTRNATTAGDANAGSGTSSSSHDVGKRFIASNMVAMPHEKEADDYMYEGDADKRSYAPSVRGVANIATLMLLAMGLFMLFAGYPIISHAVNSAYNLGGSNGTGQVPDFTNFASLIDPDTPSENQTWTHPVTNDKYHLVFSDEFEQEGRTFWPGDDPFWTAVDLWYGGTADYEWYSPEQVNTTGGALQITMEEKATHNLNFASGMVQSWNQFCFQGGYIEFSIMQPGTPKTTGYWPAAWIMGNLGRPGYLASTDGMWPYSYQSCDSGIMPNQTYANGTGPDEAIDSKATYASNGQISKLPGMRTPACTCPGGDHPGPNVNVGRSAPEIDCIEAQIQTKNGETHSWSSQSLQAAPFDVEYFWKNGSEYATVYDDDETAINTYHGGPLQEAVSAVSKNPDRGFQNTQGEYIRYGVEYEPDWNADGGGSVTWFIDGKATWTVKGTAVGPSAEMDIGQRTVPTEPMAIIMNLGMSSGFQTVYFNSDEEKDLTFPAIYRVDYVRVYQKDGQKDRISCDPKDHPTADYIANHPSLYANANLTTFADSGYSRPKNRYRDGC